MIKLFSPESFRDYINADPSEQPTFESNGTIVLEPSSCELEIVALNDSWQLKIQHPYDEDGRYTYIEKGCVVKLPCKVAHEQTSEEQLFRIFEVRDSFGQLEALAYPIAMESVYETPIYSHSWKKINAQSLADQLSLINPKYTVDTNITSAAQRSLYASETNLQGVILGDSDYTFANLFGAEVIYDNYTYHVNKNVGNPVSEAGANKIFYAINMSGIEITEDTTDLITRIYPLSSEGLGFVNPDGSMGYIDADNIEDYPIVYARVVKYDGIKLFEERDPSYKTPQTKLQKRTVAAKMAVKSRVRQLSKMFLKDAHNGDWDYEPFMHIPFNDDGNQSFLGNFSWQYDGVGYYYGDGRGHYIRNGWVEDANNIHYWCDSAGYWDQSKDDKTNVWTENATANGTWYGSGDNRAVNQWIKYGGKWHWFDKNGYLVQDTSRGTIDTTSVGNPHQDGQAGNADIQKVLYGGSDKLRWRLPYGYLFYSYTDAVEYLKDMALMGITREYDTLEDKIDATQSMTEPDPDEMKQLKQDVWNLFADAIQQGMKWVEDTDIAEWDWRDTMGTHNYDAEIEYENLPRYSWVKETRNSQTSSQTVGGTTMESSTSSAEGWWYGYVDEKGDKHKMKSAWIEESRNKHYWVDSNGWWIPADDDNAEWVWTQSANGRWWYGSSVTNCAKNQWIFDSVNQQWYWFDSEGYWVETTNHKWMFGTKNYSDYVHWGWHKIGNVWWWFDDNGFIRDALAYCEEYGWDTDSEGHVIYGHKDHHIFKNCWIEDSTSKHKWVDENGYYVETQEEPEPEPEEEEETQESEESEDSGEDEPKKAKDDTPDTTDNEPWSWHLVQPNPHNPDDKRWWYGRYYQNADGEEDPTRIQYQAKDQYMYISENQAWFQFDSYGWAVAAYTSKASWDWHSDERGWWYGDGQGGRSTFFRGQWGKIDGRWWFFDGDGYADPHTDDYKYCSKTEKKESATLETNRDGIKTTGGNSSVGSEEEVAKYDETREGVQAWITKDFIEMVQLVIEDQYGSLKEALEQELANQATKDLRYTSVPTLSINVDVALLDKMDGYEQYTYLGDLKLGDYVHIDYPERGYTLDERIVGLTYDCIAQRNSAVTIGSPKNVINRKIAGLTAKQGVVVEGSDSDVLETGYSGGDGMRYAEVSRRVQYIEG